MKGKKIEIFVLSMLLIVNVVPPSNSIRWYEYVWLLAWMLVLGRYFFRNVIHRGFKITRRAMIVLSFVGILSFGIIISLTNEVSLLYFARKLIPLLIFLFSILYVDSIKNEENRKFLNIGIMIVSTFVVIMNLSGIFLVENQNIQNIREFTSWSLPLIGLITSFSYYGTRGKLGMFSVVVSCFHIIALIIGMTRTIWLAALAVGILYFILYTWRLKINKVFLRNIALLSIFGLIGLGLARKVVPNLFQYIELRAIQFIYAIQGNDLSANERVNELIGIWNSLGQSPFGVYISGMGLGSKFQFYSTNIYRWGSSGLISEDVAHMYYGYILYHTGFVGLLLFCMLMYLSWKRGLKHLLRSGAAKNPQLATGVVGTLSLCIILFAFPPLALYSTAAIWGIIVGLGDPYKYPPPIVDEVTNNKTIIPSQHIVL